jgi:Fe2+ transport system protein FeoA
MTSMRLTTLLRDSLLSAAKSARIIGIQEYPQSMILTALVRGAKGHSGRENRLLNFGSIRNLIISVVRCAEISGYWAFQISCSQILITSEMGNNLRANRGIRALIKIYRNIFRIPENLNHYSEKDYRAAERKFLKLALEQRKTEMEEELLGE